MTQIAWFTHALRGVILAGSYHNSTIAQVYVYGDLTQPLYVTCHIFFLATNTSTTYTISVHYY
jgi:hypothetical protein